MAVYVLLLKEYADDNVVVYRFGRRQEHMGRIQLDKRMETPRGLEAVPGVQSSCFYPERAAKRMSGWFVAGEGLPERDS